MKNLILLFLLMTFLSSCNHPVYQVYRRSLMDRVSQDYDAKKVDLSSLRGFFRIPPWQSNTAEISYTFNPFRSGLSIRIFETNSAKASHRFEVTGVFTFPSRNNPSDVRVYAEFVFLEGSTWENRYALAELVIEGEEIRIEPVRFDRLALLETSPHDYRRIVTQGDAGRTIEEITFKKHSSLKGIMEYISDVYVQNSNGVAKRITLKGNTKKLWLALEKAGFPSHKLQAKSVKATPRRSCRSFVTPPKKTTGFPLYIL